MVTQGSNGAIVDLSSLSVLPTKANTAIFAVSAITSLEHAISLIDDAQEKTPEAFDAVAGSELLAGYYFGTPATGKYLAQFIQADLSVVNHVPYHLLLGPAAPAYHAVDVEARYTKDQFTRVSPALIKPSGPHALASVLSGKDSRRAAAEALSKATQEIKEKKRADSIAIGYFEQGILIGLGLYGIPLLACIGTGLFFGVRAGLRRFSFI